MPKDYGKPQMWWNPKVGQLESIWKLPLSMQGSSSTTEVISGQLIQGSQNRINQTKTNTSDVSNQMADIIAGTIAASAGIAGMYAVKPSIKQLVKTAAKKSEIDFKYSSDTQNIKEIKSIDISKILEQEQMTNDKNTNIGPNETDPKKPEEPIVNYDSEGIQNKPPEFTISSAPKDAIKKIIASEKKEKEKTYDEMDETELKREDKKVTHVEGALTLLTGLGLAAISILGSSAYGKGLNYAAKVVKTFGPRIFNALKLSLKIPLLSGQVLIEQNLNMDGDIIRAGGHEVGTMAANLFVGLIPFYGVPLIIADAFVSQTIGVSPIEEVVRFGENITRNPVETTFEKGFSSGLNRDWDRTAPKTEDLEKYVTELNESISNSKSPEEKAKKTKLLKKMQKYLIEIETRRKIRMYNTRMFNRESESFRP